MTSSEREQSKRIVYSVMYGVGKERLAEYLKTSPAIAQALIHSFLGIAGPTYTAFCVAQCVLI